MLNKLVVIFSFVILTIIPAYATSTEQPNSVPKDQNSFQTLIDNANKGDPNAQYKLGIMYEEGKGVAQDYQEALKWYTNASEQGHAGAQFNLGYMYLVGKGIPQVHNKEAAKWFIKAAEQGHAEAQQKLGFMYEQKIFDMPQDNNEAVKWYRKSAEQGNNCAKYSLGGMYIEGRGVPQDCNEAVKWWTKSAEQEGACAENSLNSLGRIYYEGQCVIKNYEKAFKWYTKAAEHGYPGGQCGLGLMYEKGNGVPEDYVQAYKWYILAAAQGWRIYGDSLKQHMTPEQIAEAQRLAKEFRPKSENRADVIEETIKPNQRDKIVSSRTGFFITSNGFILTTHHVVKDAAKLKLVTNQGVKTAVIVKYDPTNDVAILKAENAQYISLPIKSSMGVKVGADVFTVGFPNVQFQGFEPKYTKGNISSLSGIQDDPRHFQISTPVQPGNSGGPLIDSTGSVIGIVVAKMGDVEALESTGSIPQNVNYAIKSSFALALLETLPEASQNLRPLFQKERNSSEIIDDSQKAVVLILCY